MDWCIYILIAIFTNVNNATDCSEKVYNKRYEIQCYCDLDSVSASCMEQQILADTMKITAIDCDTIRIIKDVKKRKYGTCQ